MLQLDIVAVFGDAVFDPVPDVFRVIGVSRVVRGDWHDPCGQQVVVPVERVVGAVTDRPSRLGDGERVTCDAYRRLFRCLFALGELGCNRDLLLGREDRTAVAMVIFVLG